MPSPDLPATPPDPRIGPAPAKAGFAALAIVLALLVAALHFASGSFRAELGSHPDEAAHFVTGLMVRDYLASGFHVSPLRFADEYYRHYPKIGLGNWPPCFYLLQALWTLVFPVGVASILALMGLLTVALLVLTAWVLWLEFGWVEAVCGSLLLTALPLVQEYSNMVMAEILSALLMFGATVCFARFLDSAKWRPAIGFGVLAGLAIMTKGTGLALAFVPPLAILLSDRWSLFRSRFLWIAAALVIVIAGPWTWQFRDRSRAGWVEASPSLHFTQAAIFFYGREIAVALGALLACLAVIGAISIWLHPRRPSLLVCSLSLVVGVWSFQCLTPAGYEARHLTPAMPALIVLAMAGIHRLTLGIPRFRPLAAAILLILFLALPSFPFMAAGRTGYGSIGNQIPLSPFRIPVKQWSGFQPIADALVASPPRGPILVSSDARGEGMFIADMAAHDPHRPSFTVERASKILSSSAWSGAGYQSLYTTPAQVLDALGKVHISAVVTDESLPSPPAHARLLLQALQPLTTPSGMLFSDAQRDGIITRNAISLRPIPAR